MLLIILFNNDKEKFIGVTLNSRSFDKLAFGDYMPSVRPRHKNVLLTGFHLLQFFRSRNKFLLFIVFERNPLCSLRLH